MGGVPLKNLLKILLIVCLVLLVSNYFKNQYHKTEDVLVEEQPENAEEDKKLEQASLEVANPRPNEGVSTYLGQPSEILIEEIGEPDRKEPSFYDYEWWIYNKENSKYMQIGVRNGIVVTLFALGNDLNVYPFKIGQDLESIYKTVELQTEIEFNFDSGTYRFELFEDDVNSRPLIQLGDIFAQLYLDKFTNELVSIRFLDKETILLERPYDLTYRGTLIENEPDSEEEWKLAERATEQQIFDMTNVLRERYKFKPLKWDKKTAEVALKHSMDMYESNHFSHVSETYGDLSDRLKQAEIFYESAGENIAAHYTDSIAVMMGWLNSKSHREALLNKKFTHLGVGVYRKFYTQNFLQRSWE